MFRALRKSQARTLFFDAVEQWLIHIQQFSFCTQDSYKRHIRAFQAKIPNKPVSKLSPIDFRTYLNEVFLRCRTKSSANMPLVALKSFGRFLSEMYGIENPARDIKKFKVADRLRHFLTEAEYNRILEVCSERQKDIITTLAMTGVRASELIGLRWENFDDSLRRLTLVGKGSKLRVIPLNETIRSVLLKHHRKAGKISYLSKNRKCLYRTLRLVGDKVGIHLTPHLLRHYFATQLLRKGVKIAFVSKLLGHSSIAITEKVYIHFTDDFLIGVTDCLD